MATVTKRSGTRFICNGHKGDRLLATPGGGLLVVNPDHPPRLINSDGEVTELLAYTEGEIRNGRMVQTFSTGKEGV
ncbi:hypothetical protein LCGC14_1882880 [marine sediment metagenome]|uniref:Uncharacterized protein n=1 Tax=marine sediment metagenome TaxID=412755 RepID=A0A0F9GQ22_9ZZZZ